MYNGSPAVNCLLPNESSLKKRERTQNWNQEEKERLLELCRKDVQIIENKRYDARHTEAKSKIWQLIHQNFSKQFGSERSVNRLKEQWRRMKAAARSEMQEYKKRLQQCNNNSSLIENKKPSEFSYKVCDLLDEANRLCEQEIPVKTDYNTNVPEPVNDNSSTFIENNNGTSNENAVVVPENVSEKNKISLVNDLTKLIANNKDNADVKMDMKNDDKNNDNKIISNEFECSEGGVPALNQSDELDIDDSLRIDDNSGKGTSSDCLSDIDDVDNESNKSHYYDGFINNMNKSCCQNLITKMKHKEHIMRMKILKAQLKQLLRSKELLEMCKIGMENSFINCMN